MGMYGSTAVAKDYVMNPNFPELQGIINPSSCGYYLTPTNLDTKSVHCYTLSKTCAKISGQTA